MGVRHARTSRCGVAGRQGSMRVEAGSFVKPPVPLAQVTSVGARPSTDTCEAHAARSRRFCALTLRLAHATPPSSRSCGASLESTFLVSPARVAPRRPRIQLVVVLLTLRALQGRASCRGGAGTGERFRGRGVEAEKKKAREILELTCECVVMENVHPVPPVQNCRCECEYSAFYDRCATLNAVLRVGSF